MNHRALIEAALFVSEKPLSVERLSRICGINEEKVRKILKEIEEEYKKEFHGIELVETPSGFEFRIKPPFRECVARIAPLSDLSEGMMRTLAIVVSEQPIKQSTIVKYQGNKAYGYIRELEKKGLIRTEKAGRTKIVTTSPDFERYFGLKVEEVRKKLRESFSS